MSERKGQLRVVPVPSYHDMGPAERNELFVVAAVLLRTDVMDEVSGVLTSDMFLDPNLALAFRAIEQVYARGVLVDLQTVDTEMFRLDEVHATRLQGISGLKEGLRMVREVSNVMVYAAEVVRFYRLRCLQALGESLAMKANLMDGDPDALMEELERELMALRLKCVNGDMGVPMEVAGRKVLDYFKELKASGELPTGCPTGVKGLDELMGGVRPCELMFLAARPGDGKTAMGLHMALACARAGLPALFVTMEMSDEELVKRMFAKLGDISPDSMRLYGPSLKELREMERVTEEVMPGLPLRFLFAPSITLEQLRAKVLMAVKRGECKVLFVDYIHLMQLPKGMEANPVGGLGVLANGLKSLAMQAKIPLISMAQMSRKIEERGPAAVPLSSDMRDSGILEQAADIILFIRKPGKKDNRAKSREGTFFLTKMRNGGTGEVDFRYSIGFTSFEEVSSC